MNLNITIADDVRQEVKDGVKSWLNEVAIWSQARYPAIDLATSTTISIETHEWFTGVAVKPQKRPFEIRISDGLDFVEFNVEQMQKYHLKPTGRYYVGSQIGFQAAAAALFESVQYTLARDLGDDSFRENWTVRINPPETKMAWLKEFHPDLVDSWWDQNRYVESIKKKPSKEHWRFPALNPKLCRYGEWGPGAVFPEGSGRK